MCKKCIGRPARRCEKQRDVAGETPEVAVQDAVRSDCDDTGRDDRNASNASAVRPAARAHRSNQDRREWQAPMQKHGRVRCWGAKKCSSTSRGPITLDERSLARIAVTNGMGIGLLHGERCPGRRSFGTARAHSRRLDAAARAAQPLLLQSAQLLCSLPGLYCPRTRLRGRAAAANLSGPLATSKVSGGASQDGRRLVRGVWSISSWKRFSN